MDLLRVSELLLDRAEAYFYSARKLVVSIIVRHTTLAVPAALAQINRSGYFFSQLWISCGTRDVYVNPTAATATTVERSLKPESVVYPSRQNLSCNAQ